MNKNVLHAGNSESDPPKVGPDFNCSNMFELAILLKKCDEDPGRLSEYSKDGLISFVDEIDKETGKATRVKVLL